MNSYTIVKLKNDRSVLCKILNEYETEQEAEKDLLKVATKKISEKDLLKQYAGIKK